VHTYKNKNNSRMKRTKVSIVDLHAEQQARGNGRVTGQLLWAEGHMHSGEHERRILPDMVVADELVSWYTSCLRGSYSKAQCSM
jgi:hypothetical protein